MPDHPRIGIVGLGGIGTHHAETINALDGTIAGGADLDPRARDVFQDAFDVPTYDTHTALLDTDTVDGLIVTTPNQYHRSVALAALERDIPVLVEKPLADTLASARDIAAATHQSNAFCMTGFHNRYSGPVRILREAIEDGELGEIVHVEANYIRRRGIPGRGSWFTDRAVAGGGSLIDVGVHVLDLALHFIDHDHELTILGTTRTNFGDRGTDYPYLHMWGEDDPTGAFDVDDSASAFIRTGTEASISLEVAWATNRPPSHTIYVRGTEGGAALDIEAGTLTRYETQTGPPDHHRDTDLELGEADAYLAEQEAFLSAITAGTTPTQNTVEEALLVQQVVDGIYRSSKTGDAVGVAPLRNVTEEIT